MKTITLAFFILFFTSLLFSQTAQRPYKVSEPYMKKGGAVVSAIADPAGFVQQRMIGECVTVSNIQVNYPGSKPAVPIGSWSDSTNTLGIDSGMVITTGDALSIIDSVQRFISYDIGGNGDPILSALCGANTYDAVSIEFDFIPQADSIIPFEFVFGSEEYLEYVNSGYNDVFGFFISGPGYTGQQNIAILPGTTIPITIDNVNNLTNAQYYINNEALGGTFLAYDGYTVVFSLSVPVIANQQYHFKLAVADAGDHIFDSGVIIKMGSFAGNIIAPAPSFTYTINGNNVSFTNTTTNGMSYVWDFGDGTTSTDVNPVHNYSGTGSYTLRLMASNHCYTEEIEQVIDLNSNYTGICSRDKYVVSTLSESGIFSISGIATDAWVEIYTSGGQQIQLPATFNGTNLVVDLSRQPRGIYILKTDGRTFKLAR